MKKERLMALQVVIRQGLGQAEERQELEVLPFLETMEIQVWV